jgi:5-methyltetrahydropteroyltriglutamate--homocysteine methyltransferase
LPPRSALSENVHNPRMTARATPPFRADHVGSLLRPPELKQARAEFKAGSIDRNELRTAEDEAIRDAIALQKEVGLEAVTDGELRRSSWHMDFIYQLGGVEQDDRETQHSQFRNKERTYEFTPPTARVTSAVHLEAPIFADDFAFVRDNAATGQTPKLTIPAPSMIHLRGGDPAIDEDAYPDREQFWADLAAAYRDEVSALYDLGCRYLQLDDVSLAYVNDPNERRKIEELGGDPLHMHERYIAAANASLQGRPDDLVVTTHLCRGNNQSMWAAEGGYEFVAESLFNDLDVDGYFLEFDDERSGGFEPLRFVPKGKIVVLGLITTKRAELESKDEVKRRIEEAAKFVDIDQLCLSPQCGFSSTEQGNDLTIDEQRAKLQLVVEVAGEVWT